MNNEILSGLLGSYKDDVEEEITKIDYKNRNKTSSTLINSSFSRKRSRNEFNEENNKKISLLLPTSIKKYDFTLTESEFFESIILLQENIDFFTSSQKIFQSDYRKELLFQRKLLKNKISQLITNHFNETNYGKIKVKLFGSSATNLFIDESDIDIIIYSEKKIQNFLLKVENILKNNSFFSDTNFLLKDTAKVPVLKASNFDLLPLLLSNNNNNNNKINNNNIINNSFTDKNIDQNLNKGKEKKMIEFDITYSHGGNNEQFIHSQQIKSWTRKKINKDLAKNDRLFEIILLIKMWSKHRDLNNPFRNTLPSLGYLVMIFNVFEDFIETKNEDPFYQILVRSFNELDDNNTDINIESINTNNINNNNNNNNNDKIISKINTIQKYHPAFLLFKFFYKFVNWDRNKCVWCSDSVGGKEYQEIVRLQNIIKDPDMRGFGSTVFIQDPFLLSINLGRFVDDYSFPRMINEFKKALYILFFPSFRKKFSMQIIHKLLNLKDK